MKRGYIRSPEGVIKLRIWTGASRSAATFHYGFGVIKFIFGEGYHYKPHRPASSQDAGFIT
jgi:hypothetical protein